MIRIAVLLLAVNTLPAADPALRVLILSGHNDHDWRTSTPALRHMLEGSGRFDCKVTEEPAGLTETILSGYDAVVSDYNGPRLGPVAERALESFVRQGKGLAVVHGASHLVSNPEMPGAHQNRTGKRRVFAVKFKDSNHPIAKGLPASFFISDELHDEMKGVGNPASIADRVDTRGDGSSGKRDPVLMVSQFGKGRVFRTTLGHDAIARSSPAFIQTFTRGVEWAATGKVTLPDEPGVLRTHNKDAVNVLVVTGGHEYDPSFDSLFEGDKRIRANVDPHPVALNKELRKRYDVIVFYDMMKTLTEKQKQNLLNFAESGKGIVVMHHALVNYPGEDWWREIAGAQYLEGKSTFLHDRELIATPSGDHPVLSGVPEMYMHDETYKGMWFAETNNVLLTTRDETADGPLAWISGYTKSRVVSIQPGHNRESHNNEGFRRLVHNAILWSAGKM